VGAAGDDTGGDHRGAVLENTELLLPLMASDADLPTQPLTFSIAGGADQARFTMLGDQTALLFKSPPPDFDAPSDSNADNVYVVIVQASDGTLAGVKAILVTVTPVNDHRPVFTSADMLSVPENTTTVITVTATDVDRPPQTVTFSIIGGPDQARFTITNSGLLSFNSPPDFEMPTDSNGDNTYLAIVQASDGDLTSLQAILITVTAAEVLRDYDGNGTVDAVDYVLWRNGGPLTNDPPWEQRVRERVVICCRCR
jgi:serralysin